MEEQLVLAAFFSAGLCNVRESEQEDSEDDELQEVAPHPLVTELQTSLQSLFDTCAGFPTCASEVKLAVHPPKLVPGESLCDAVLSWVISYQRELHKRLATLQQVTASRIHSAEISGRVSAKLLKAKDELLDSVSEELYLAQIEKCTFCSFEQLSPVSSLRQSFRRADGSAIGNDLFEVEETDCDREKKLAGVLRLDSMRQRLALSHCLRSWTSVVGLSKDSLEGRYKRDILQRNPLLSLSDRTDSRVLPPPYLFNQLFTFLDQCFSALMSDLHGSFSCVKCLVEGTVQKRVAAEVIGGMDSLNAFYSEDSMIAGLFARLLQVFDPDPLLSAPTKELVRLNAQLKTLVAKRHSVRDCESGGYIPMRDALAFALTLNFSQNEPLMAHFLQAIAPEEMEAAEWSKFVESFRKQSRFAAKPYAEDLPELSATISLFEVGRGELLGYLLQVYDLYVDQLYVLVSSHASEGCVESSAFRRLVATLHSSFPPEHLSEVWMQAQAFSPQQSPDAVHQDAALLALISSRFSEVAAKPLTPLKATTVLTIQTELSEENDDACTSLGSLSSRGRTLFTPKGRQSVRRKARTFSISADVSF